MTDETPAPVSAELLWTLIERKAEENPEFRLYLLSYVLLQSQSTTMAGRLFDLLELPRDHNFPDNINPLSMLRQVGIGTLETTATAEDLGRISHMLKGILDFAFSGNDPALLQALAKIATSVATIPESAPAEPNSDPPSQPDPQPDS